MSFSIFSALVIIFTNGVCCSKTSEFHHRIISFLWTTNYATIFFISAHVFPYSQNGDWRPIGHICQHAWRVIIPAGCVVSLRRCQQPEETRLKSANVLKKWVTSDQLYNLLMSGAFSFKWKIVSFLRPCVIRFLFSIHRTDGILTNMDTTFPTFPVLLSKDAYLYDCTVVFFI